MNINKSIQWFVKCVLIAILFVPSIIGFGQITYYVSGDGNDSNNGQTINTPIQSITRANQLVLQPGDRVLFRRGDTFRGGLTLFRSGTSTMPIIFDAYGTGAKPVISGSIPLSGWTSVGSNVWQATCQQCGTDVRGLYDNGVALPLGRYPNLDAPNKGYLTVQSHIGNTQLTSKEPLSTNWTGGEAVVRPLQWILDRATITQQNANTLTLNNQSSYGISDGWGYFIQNHPATLDQNNEWYYNPSTKIVRLYSSQGNPNTKQITVAVVGEGFTTYNQSFIAIQNLHFTQNSGIGFYAATTNNLTVKNVDVTNSGTDGMQINGSGSNVLFESNYIYKINNNAFQIQQYSNVTFRNNTIRHVGLVPGRGGSGDGQYLGFNAYAEQNLLVENNRIDSIGYNGIAYAHNNTTIQRNVISNVCMTKSDGAGIYSWNGTKAAAGNVRILNNIIYKSIGAPEGSIYTTYSGANGICLDDCSQGIEVKGNTIFDCFGLGVIFHGTYNTSFIDNLCYNNREGQFVMAHNEGICPMRNHTVQTNVLVSKLVNQSVARYESVDTDLGSYGTIDNNYYVRPFNDVVKIGAGYKDGNTGAIINGDVSLTDWQNLFGKDLNAKGSPVTYKDYTINSLSGAYKLNSTFDTNFENWYPYSYHGNAQTNWENANRLDGGHLRVDFPTASGRRGSYVFVFNGVGIVNKSKSYILRFDAIASAENKSIEVFLRQRDGTFTDLTPRYSVSVGTTRKSYEIGFINPTDENDAIVMFKIAEDGKTLWLDNINVQEAFLTLVNPDNYIKFAYNPTNKDSLVTLDGVYKNVKNVTYSQSVLLTPFTSIILLKDVSSIAAADLNLFLQANKQVLKTGELLSFRLRIRNDGIINAGIPVQIQWTSQLPANLQFVNGTGLNYTNGILSGAVKSLSGQQDTTFIFDVKPLQPGRYETTAQIATTSLPDPDSSPNSGTGDGEDDQAKFTFRTNEASSNVYVSPNPNQNPLPPVNSSQPSPDPNKADLNLRMSVSNRNPSLNDVISYSMIITNAGGLDVGGVQVRNQLPTGLQFVGGAGWSASGNIITSTITSVPKGATISLSFLTRVVSLGTLINLAQINAAATTDPDSTPGNGFLNGEDDRAQIDIRSK